ncbi:MAG: hypothetical protein JW751_23500 [Polyangiaceae bacterium]|nr:hypothetical protein [Polyangiaceae bacterium]
MTRWAARFSRSRLGVLALGFTATALAAPPEPDLGPSVLQVPVKEYEAEQGILTPIPVSIELPPQIAAARVLLHYRTFGSSRWVSLELVRQGGQWTGAIPCLEVSTITGDVSYYLRVHDVDGAVVAYSGTRALPYKVRIVHDSARSSETLDRPRCPDPSDCPAGLPGCPSEEVEQVPCKSNRDCEGGSKCGWRGLCEVDHREHFRLGLDLAQDFGLIDTTGACSLESQETRGYLCHREYDGAQYYGTPAYTNEPVRAAVGPTRVVAGFDVAVGPDAALGLRLGFAFRGAGPTAPGGIEFLPLLIEGRVTHWFGDDPFEASGLRPFAFLSGGYAMFDFKARTHIREDPRTGGRQTGNDLDQQLEVRKRAGDVFLGAGAGASLVVWKHAALRGDVTAAAVFPFGAFVVTPRLGAEVGF